MQANNLNGFLVAYSLKSLPQFISYAPMLGNYSTDFSAEIAGGGTAVVTRLATTAWTANRTDLNGYAIQPTTSSAVTVTLVQKDVTDAFSELAWAASIPEVLINTFVPGQSMTLANTVVVDLIGSLSGSSTAGSTTVGAAGFSYTSASVVAATLDKAFVPRTNRTLIVAPDQYQQINASLSPTYIYGNSNPIQNYENIKVVGFDTYQFGGIKDAPYNVATSATLNSIGTGVTWQKLVGIASHKSALAIAARAPLEVNNGLVTAVNQTDETSGFTMQNRVSYLQTTGQYQLSSTAIYGVSQGNGYGAVLIFTA
jgi:hypothetical protein